MEQSAAVKESPFVFVYGTLKRGYGNHSVMRRAKGRLIGKHVTEPKWTMHHLGAYPGISQGGHTEITGEVYEVDSLLPLDVLEGYPHFYNRTLIETQYGPAWVYFLKKPSAYANFNVVESGVWED